jgi:hypothetical protein
MICDKILLTPVACIAAAILLVSQSIGSSSPIQTKSTSLPQVFAQDQEVPFVVQNTNKSTQDPLPGHETHQVVIAAPPRSDGKTYSGLVTFVASTS